MADNPVTPNSSNWTPQTIGSANWTPKTINNTNWNTKDAFASFGELLLMDNKSQLLAEDNSTAIVLQ